MQKSLNTAFPILLALSFASCNQAPKKEEIKNTPFELMTSEVTGIDFVNKLTNQQDFDVFRYRNYYNGGGVAIGDINNDGLADLYMVSNMEKDRLYLNKGNWKFEDITDKAGLGGSKSWSTGVAMADVNGDGWLDIYVCNSGNINGDTRENELFINNGNLTFSEKAKEIGLADIGYTTHAAFFDYDKDGDLDCYILNNSFRPIGTLGYRNLRNQRDELGGHKLMRNDDGVFKDVSEHAGIYGSVIGFGLGVTVGDVDNDGWPDIYVSNDFYERDYLYMNKHDGTFSEELEKYMGHISMFSMGADMADINNDGFLDILSTDMLPQEDYRLKKLTAFESYDTYQLRLRTGYYHQFMRNMLQLNQDGKSFMEIGQMAGVDATDWSWGALIADFNNDGVKELFVCNGIFKDVTDQDFIEYMGSSEKIKEAVEGKKINFAEFVDGMSSTKLSNVMFQRDSLLHFKNVSKDWGIDQPSFSNGSAYGDLDNDGDLDLVVNNLNMPSFIYQNHAEREKKNSVSVTFKGTAKNVFGIGVKVKVYSAGGFQYLENMPMRGFQSSMDYKLVFGIDTAKVVDSLIATWPDGNVQILKKLPANKVVNLDYQQASLPKATNNAAMKSSRPLLMESKAPAFKHRENEYSDFNRERLIFHLMSTQGPACAKGDVNQDGLDDFYVGGGKGQSGTLMIQTSAGEFLKYELPVLQSDSASEDVDAIFFDADGDKKLDLLVITGGTEFVNQSKELQDHLYINKSIGGRIDFIKSGSVIGGNQVGSCATASDIDHDGDLDLFIGTRVVAGYYGNLPGHQILVNDGRGGFADATSKWYPDHEHLGMVTDAEWTDLDGDGWDDLVLVGEWMPVTVLKNDGTHLKKIEHPSLIKSEGWWNSITVADINNDKKPDLLLGNLGWNSRFRTSKKDPIRLFVNDFDGNGSVDPVYTYHKDGKDFPFALRQDMLKQLPNLKKKFLYFKDYAGKSIDEIFSVEQLQRSRVLQFCNASTSIAINKGNLEFELKSLPWQAQVSPVFAMVAEDVNRDSNADLIIGGNFFGAKPEVGRSDALKGLVLLGDGKGNFKPLPSSASGIDVVGETRRIISLRSKKGKKFVFARNNETLKIFEQ